ncbi:NAD(P)H-dependent oxidoreductase subunit E [Methylocystis heyeri]|uniref:NADH-ubiquinone oxidoreductase 51kDa subunit iron-sulphur binding domain-containing protein n=1 Tax=Methylocystis heyeri TaxID=391905 RepID=A0A6B8KK41_9HYPH|nr:NADH-ubiquinone oxidoreductase-F iron-sulfur binding region domain-containing protein [Methylocystis heyeri]QGM47471.1 hypothetical protein H2LOC_018255 [Methylocystis heyeri]
MDLADQDYAATIEEAARKFGGERHRLLDMLQHIHSRLGFLDRRAVETIAAVLQCHPAEVEDVASFYSFFNREPKGRFHIRLARTPVSMMKGAEDVARAFAQATGAQIGGTSADGDFSLDWASDLGMADQEPSALINGAPFPALAPFEAGPIVAELRRNRDSTNPLPLFPGSDASSLARAQAPIKLIRPGPILFDNSSGGADAIKNALRLSPDGVVKEITKARLRGRGGAGFPTGLKWRLCRQAQAEARYVVCNADEGEPGTFKDRALLTLAPGLVLDGMAIAAHALGARQGVIYLRGEYACLEARLTQEIDRRRRYGLLGTDICGVEGFDFDIRIQLGAGAYICGEESALIESLEGKRGAPRDRPPFPTDRGYLGCPTAVDNVETFACASRIMERGAAWFCSFGTAESAGTKLLSVSGDCAHPGVYELPFGTTLNELLDLVGAPDARFVQVGGPSGQCVGPKDYGRRIAYEDLSTGGSVMAFGPERDVLATALQFTEFFADESCGWCVPCRVGTTLLRQDLEKILRRRGTLSDVTALDGLARSVARTSRCGLGQSAPNPILSTMRNFPEAYEALLQAQDFLPRFLLSETLIQAQALQGRGLVGAEEE